MSWRRGGGEMVGHVFRYYWTGMVSCGFTRMVLVVGGGGAVVVGGLDRGGDSLGLGDVWGLGDHSDGFWLSGWEFLLGWWCRRLRGGWERLGWWLFRWLGLFGGVGVVGKLVAVWGLWGRGVGCVVGGRERWRG
jgi:hypothetical protein